MRNSKIVYPQFGFINQHCKNIDDILVGEDCFIIPLDAQMCGFPTVIQPGKKL